MLYRTCLLHGRRQMSIENGQFPPKFMFVDAESLPLYILDILIDHLRFVAVIKLWCWSLFLSILKQSLLVIFKLCDKTPLG